MTTVWRIDAGAGPRLAAGHIDSGPEVLLPAGVRVADLLAPGGWDRLAELADGGEPAPPSTASSHPSTSRTCGPPA